MLLERPHTRSRRPRQGRRWRPADTAPLPAREPGRAVLNALLAPVRRARGCTTRGDDRLETSAYAVKRYLYRLAHAQKSGRFACSIEQLVAGLAPIVGWRRRDGESRRRLAKRHRASVQRWLEDLQQAGVVTVEGERDDQGMWWRTIITLRDPPTPNAQDLTVARERLRAWKRRRRAARRRRRPPRRCLEVIRRCSQRPGADSRRRSACQRAAAVHEARRRRDVEQTIASARERRSDTMKDLRHPFGAPPPSAHVQASSKRSEQPDTPEPTAPTAVRSAPTFPKHVTVDDETGARTHERPVQAPNPAPAVPKECTERATVPGNAPAHLGPLALAALEARRAAARWRVAELARQAALRAREVVRWPSGRACPLGRLREAWVVHRHGPQAAANWGAAAAGPVTPALATLVGRAIRLYEAYVNQRPPGWPTSGPAALMTLARRGDGTTLRGTGAWLLYLAKHMRAAALEHDPDRLQRMTRRAERRRTPVQTPLPFRTGDWRTPRFEAAEARRQRVRDQLLLAGDDPRRWPNAELAIDWYELGRGELRGPNPHELLDGLQIRADRYRDQLANGYWQLSNDGSDVGSVSGSVFGAHSGSASHRVRRAASSDVSGAPANSGPGAQP